MVHRNAHKYRNDKAWQMAKRALLRLRGGKKKKSVDADNVASYRDITFKAPSSPVLADNPLEFFDSPQRRSPGKRGLAKPARSAPSRASAVRKALFGGKKVKTPVKPKMRKLGPRPK